MITDPVAVTAYEKRKRGAEHLVFTLHRTVPCCNVHAESWVSYMPMYRIRMCSGSKGGRNHYHHADVIARDRQGAMRAAREGRVRNWRWIDSFDTADKTYTHYEFLYRLDESEASLARAPIPLMIHRAKKRAEKISGVTCALADSKGRILHVYLSERASASRDAVRRALPGTEVRFHYPIRVCAKKRAV